MSSVDDLAAFLARMLDEREQLARQLRGVQLFAYLEGGDDGWAIEEANAGGLSAIIGDQALAKHIALHGPAAVLADVEAKRLLLALHSPTPGPNPSCNTCFDGWAAELEAANWPCASVRLLALPFADRPGYDERWKP